MQGLATVLMARLADVVVSVILVAVWIPAFLRVSPDVAQIAVIVLGSSAFLTSVIWVLHKPLSKRVAQWAMPAYERIQKSLAEVLAIVRRCSWQVLIRVAIFTLMWKLFNALIYWQLAQSLKLDLGFNQVFGAMLMYSLFMVLPLPTLAGFGTSEAWWMLSLKAEGASAAHAALAALTFHVGNLFLLTLVGFWPMVQPFLHGRATLPDGRQMNGQKE